MTKRSNHRDRINGLDQARDRSAAKAAHTTVADEIAILEKLLAEKRAANQNASQLSENGIAETDGVLQPTEDAMYSWISPNPYQHYNRFKVWFRDLEGERKSKSFGCRSFGRQKSSGLREDLIAKEGTNKASMGC
jgi:hypothetical protein